MSDIEAPVVENVAPDTAAPAADPSPAPAGPPPSRIDVIRNAVAAQKEKATPREDKPAAPAATSDRPRAADGKFVPIQTATATPGIDKPAPDRTAAAPIAPAAAAPAGDAPAPATDTTIRPPPGWSPQSKVAFDSLPEHLKADIAKRESEINKGFEKLARYKGVDKYMDMAERGGTTLDRALEQYTGIENLLRRDVFAGVEQVLRNVGVNPVSFAQAYLARNQGGQQAPNAQPQARQPAVDPREIARQVREQVQADFENQRIAESVQKFSNDPKNRFFENVKPMMGKLLSSGAASTIEEAYDMACRLDPTIAPLLNQTAPADPNAVKAAAAASAARAAAKAVTGAPAPGMAPGVKAQNPNASRRDIIVAAVAAQKARA